MAQEFLSQTKQPPITLSDRAAASVPTPSAGTLVAFAEGGVLKVKDSTGTVVALGSVAASDVTLALNYATAAGLVTH